MVSRSTVIAGLLVIELTIVGAAFASLQGGRFPLYPPGSAIALAAGPHLIEGGPHKVFDAQPALTVDIGYADLTILAAKGAQIDVSLSPSTTPTIFGSPTTITARQDGQTIRIVATNVRKWSIGDNRRLTVVVPPETRVTVIHAGDIKATGLRAEASFDSVGNGTITVEDFNAPVLRAESSGRISLHQIVAARLIATSSDDRIEGTSLQVRDGTVESDGRMTLGLAAGSDTLINAEASDGHVNVTGFTTTAVAADDDSTSKTVRVGAGTGHLDVHTHDGNIRLIQED